ncbi:MAG: glycosyltransferase [Prevotellaceae bacterium]|jgi:glycosyltransferase involved in cell wall biosynthesis|nr:glycosyltransferase [Prevotellaceae bacterium]
MKLVFLSNFALDANVSLVKELNQQCDVYFITEALYRVYNYLDKEKLSKMLSVGTDVEELQLFSDFLPLSKTFVVRGVPNRQILKKLWISYQTHRLVKKIKPDIVMVDCQWGLSYIFTTLRYRKVTLSVVHDPFPHSGEGKFVSQLFRNFFFALIPNKLLLNKAQRQQFIEANKQDANNTFSSFLSVYTYLTCFAPKETIYDGNNFNLLFFGRISPYKGIKYLLDAFVNITEQNKIENITLTIAGSGDFNFDIAPYEKYGNITIINRFVESDELAGLVQNSSAVVCPYTDATQSGVVMTAFAFKKPVIATCTGGLPEMITHRETGLIVEPKNVEELESAIITLHNNPDLLKTMEKNIEKEYFHNGKRSWRVAAQRFTDAFNRIITQKK